MTNASQDDLQAEVARLRAENEKLKANANREVRMKVSDKGGLSIYGLGRFPVTLYPEQWTTLLNMSEEIRAFIQEHKGALKWKEDAKR